MRREMLEEDLWFSEYNRDSNGIIHLKDEKTGEAIPRGAGVLDILKAVGNYETYSVLTLNRLTVSLLVSLTIVLILPLRNLFFIAVKVSHECSMMLSTMMLVLRITL